MPFLPIAQTVPQYHNNGEPASGFVLKAYAAGTSTNINLATDNTGGTTASSMALNSQGYPEVSGSIVIPHVEESYKLVLYPTQAAADADTGATWTIDNLTAAVNAQDSTDEKVLVSANDTTAGFLNGKLIIGNNIVFTEGSDGSDETLTIDGWKKGADVISATALPLIAGGNYVDVTGTTTITSFNTLGVGSLVKLHFDAILTLTHNATDLILPGGADITTAAGDEAEFFEYATGDWRCINYQRASNSVIGAVVANHIRAGNTQILSGEVTSGIDFFPTTSITENTFESVGPTGSGATNIWEAMDNIPSNATILLVAIQIAFSPAGTGQGSISFHTTHGDDPSPAKSATTIAHLSGLDVDSAITGNSTSWGFPVFIPLGATNQDFLATWEGLLEQNAVITLTYRGFMTD